MLSLISASGSLVSLLHRPNNDAACLTGPGLDSRKSELWSLANCKLIFCAFSVSFFRQANCISEQSFGATFAVTDIHP